MMNYIYLGIALYTIYTIISGIFSYLDIDKGTRLFRYKLRKVKRAKDGITLFVIYRKFIFSPIYIAIDSEEHITLKGAITSMDSFKSLDRKYKHIKWMTKDDIMVENL